MCFSHCSRSLCLVTECDCEISAIAQHCLNFLQSKIRRWPQTLKPSFAPCQRKNSMQLSKPSVLTWILWSPFRWVHWSHLWEIVIDTVIFSRAFSLGSHPCISRVNYSLAVRKKKDGLYHWSMNNTASSCHSYPSCCSVVLVEHKCVWSEVQFVKRKIFTLHPNKQVLGCPCVLVRCCLGWNEPRYSTGTCWVLKPSPSAFTMGLLSAEVSTSFELSYKEESIFKALFQRLTNWFWSKNLLNFRKIDYLGGDWRWE